MSDIICPEQFDDWEEAYDDWKDDMEDVDEAEDDLVVAGGAAAAAALTIETGVGLIAFGIAFGAELEAADDLVDARRKANESAAKSNAEGSKYEDCVEDFKNLQPVVTPLPIVTPLPP